MANNNGDNEKKPLTMAELIALARQLDPNSSTQKPAEVEPSAELRQSALQMRQLHNSFVWAGWTDDQAVTLTAALLGKAF